MNNSLIQQITWALLRVIPAFLFMLHGAQKHFGVLGFDQPVELMSQIGAAGVLEFYGGAFVLIGLFTRPVAFVLSGQMAVAYWMSHAPRGAWPVQNGGELAALYCFLFLFIAFHGGGRFSVDAYWRKRSQPAAG